MQCRSACIAAAAALPIKGRAQKADSRSDRKQLPARLPTWTAAPCPAAPQSPCPPASPPRRRLPARCRSSHRGAPSPASAGAPGPAGSLASRTPPAPPAQGRPPLPRPVPDPPPARPPRQASGSDINWFQSSQNLSRRARRKSNTSHFGTVNHLLTRALSLLLPHLRIAQGVHSGRTGAGASRTHSRQPRSRTTLSAPSDIISMAIHT
jgi:hypothetical protein